MHLPIDGRIVALCRIEKIAFLTIGNAIFQKEDATRAVSRLGDEVLAGERLQPVAELVIGALDEEYAPVLRNLQIGTEPCSDDLAIFLVDAALFQDSPLVGDHLRKDEIVDIGVGRRGGARQASILFEESWQRQDIVQRQCIRACRTDGLADKFQFFFQESEISIHLSPFGAAIKQEGFFDLRGHQVK